MYELLRAAEQSDPARPAVTTHDGVWTYADMASAARAVAGWLTAEGVDRFAVADHEAPAVLPLLAGASIAGAQACLLPPDPPDTVDEIARRVGLEVVVTNRQDLAGRGTDVVAVDDAVGSSRSLDVIVDGSRPHTVLTTGTTGAPRAVRHDWTRLVRGTRHVAPSPDDRWLLAFGVHQFAGLQVMLHVAAAGAVLVAPAPRRPREGLRAMRELGVTHASATPTYWRFLLAELRDGGPVPSLSHVTLGGEAVPAAVLAGVHEAFPAATVAQVYAGSEFGSTGSVRDGRPGLSVDVLERGDDADVALRVIDGELWIRSRTGMLGYVDDAADADPDAWRPTGDLVEIVGDRVEFRGRTSDVINVGGVKVHPLVVEEIVDGVAGVAAARVFGRPSAMTGSIVAVDIVLDAGADEGTVKAAVRSACERLDRAARPRRVRFVEELATVGSKVVRRSQDD